jgi:hypothetical protein
MMYEPEGQYPAQHILIDHRIGLAWLGLAWLGLAWLGLACLDCLDYILLDL